MMKRIKYILFSLGIIIGAIFIVQFCYAQSNQSSTIHAPEPGTLALISTGIFGGLIRFAQKRFNDFKRLFDIIIGCLGLVVAIPIIGFTAIVIKIVSPGSIFFTQKRIGRNGEIFAIWKLRTMKVDAEKYTGAVWAEENDPRLIRFGKYIRKMHIDELPQLFNVLKGDMSIIGPRPERPEIVGDLKEVVPEYEKRLKVKPGITGLAQIWHKYDETIEDVKKKIKYDLLYIRKMCLMVDLRILAQTLIVVMTGKGAR